MHKAQWPVFAGALCKRAGMLSLQECADILTLGDTEVVEYAGEVFFAAKCLVRAGALPFCGGF